MIFLIALGALVATALGGIFAIRFQDKLHLVLGFSAGALMGVALFDLLPESIELSKAFFSTPAVMLFIAVGFVTYMILDRAFFKHGHGNHDAHDNHAETGAFGGHFGAGSLSFHSFLDGVAIGIAWHVSVPIGLVVAAAVLAHDFSDGINTVSMILRHGGSRMRAFKWLAVDAIAPVVGIIVSSMVSFPDSVIGPLLAVFCGFFLYIGASDLLPESHHNHPTSWTTVATVLGMAVVYGAVTLAGV
ncbi:MAG: ZIP family metal transporter [Candidatus Paceibacterota bacterium]|jgi:ZIP family zinc transporter